MNSNDILKAIDTIAAHPGKKDKERLVKEYGEASPEFKRVLVAALDPMVTYGMKNVPERDNTASDGAVWDESIWSALDRLASRALTGNAARDVVWALMNTLSADSAELLKRVIKKDLRAGFGDNTVNKVFKGLLPEFPYMRCSLPKHVKLQEWDWAEGVISQEKADGMFVNVTREGPGVVTFTSRQGTEIPFPEGTPVAVAAAEVLADHTQTHGELLVVDPGGEVCAREIGNGMLNSFTQGGALDEGYRIVLHVWDQIPLSVVQPKGRHATHYVERLRALIAQLKRGAMHSAFLSLIDTRIVRSYEEALDHYREYLAKGKEGTVIKLKSAIWRDGTSKEQIKMKLEAECELRVVGFEPGNGKNAGTFGSLICLSECTQLEVCVSGISDALRLEIHNNRDAWLDSIITVRSNSIMKPSKVGKPYSLFLPRFVERRHDKTKADNLVRIREQFDNAIKAV